MARATRIDTQRLDLAGFEAWLRSQLPGPAFAAVLTVVLQMIRALFEQNTQLRARILGRSLKAKPPSERLSALERQLAFGFLVPVNDVTPTATPHASGSEPDKSEPKDPPRRSPRAKQPLPKHIAVIEVPNNVPTAERVCKDCDLPMTTMRHRRVDTFELHPARLVIQRRLDEVVTCPRCDAIRCAKAPPSLLDGGLLGPTLVTEATADKILNGMPVERQARTFRQQGVPISASTLGRSMSSLLALLVPLAERIRVRVRHSERLQLDSTGLRVLDPTAMTGIVRDTLWVLIGDRRWVSFAALQSGDGDTLEALMRDAEAETFQCDGTSTTNFVEKKWHRCRPGCHAHARRKLVEAVRRGDLRAIEPLRLYALLFKIEREATRQGLSPEALQRRREIESVPLLEQLRAWVLATAPGVEPKSPLGEALTYLQRQRLRLCVFVLDGRIEMTNHRSERELRPWTLGQQYAQLAVMCSSLAAKPVQ
jgi:transposase